MKRLSLVCLIMMQLMAICGVGNICASNGSRTLSVASYNIRIVNHQDSIEGNGWQQRCPKIVDLVRFHNFDIFGTQEGLRPALDNLKTELGGFDYIGVGCDDGDGKGGHNAIFYNVDCLEPLADGTFWLSETPDTVSLGWDGQYRRICTWGRFRHKVSGVAFMFFNVHLDHIGVVARREGAKLILSKIEELREGLPVVLTGDFNADQDSECYAIIAKSELLDDACVVAPDTYITASTFNNFDVSGVFLTPDGEFQRIDHIFLSRELQVGKYGVLTDTYHAIDSSGTANVRLPSDHYPVNVIIRF